eukprot:1513163-Ditylum_brightwellii.AAC.1
MEINHLLTGGAPQAHNRMHHTSSACRKLIFYKFEFVDPGYPLSQQFPPEHVYPEILCPTLNKCECKPAGDHELKLSPQSNEY